MCEDRVHLERGKENRIQSHVSTLAGLCHSGFSLPLVYSKKDTRQLLVIDTSFPQTHVLFFPGTS